MAKAAPQPELSFPLKHPALVATLVTLALVAGFIGALYQSATGHHEGGEHGAVPAPGAAGSGAHAAQLPAAQPSAAAPAPAKH